MTKCANCDGQGCSFCRADNTIPSVAPETLSYIQQRTGIVAKSVSSAVGLMVHRIVQLECQLGAMTEQRDIYRDAVGASRMED